MPLNDLDSDFDEEDSSNSEIETFYLPADYCSDLSIIKDQLEQARSLIDSGEAQKIFARVKEAEINAQRDITTLNGTKYKKQHKESNTPTIVDWLGVEQKEVILDAPLDNSVINFHGDPYILLHRKIFISNQGLNLSEGENGYRYGKLAINEKGEIFFLKVLMTDIGSEKETDFRNNAHQEMRLASNLELTPYKESSERFDPVRDTKKTLLLYRFKGIDLRNIFKPDPTYVNLLSISLEEKIDIIFGCLELLVDIHKRGYVYRDFKQLNIVAEITLSKDGLLKLTKDPSNNKPILNIIDIETLREISEDAEGNRNYRSNSFRGTKRYIPPKIRRNEEVKTYNFITDLYAIYITIVSLYENIKNTQEFANTQPLLIKNLKNYITTITQVLALSFHEVPNNLFYNNPLVVQEKVENIIAKFHTATESQQPYSPPTEIADLYMQLGEPQIPYKHPDFPSTKSKSSEARASDSDDETEHSVELPLFTEEKEQAFDKTKSILLEILEACIKKLVEEANRIGLESTESSSDNTSVEQNKSKNSTFSSCFFSTKRMNYKKEQLREINTQIESLTKTIDNFTYHQTGAKQINAAIKSSQELSNQFIAYAKTHRSSKFSRAAELFIQVCTVLPLLGKLARYARDCYNHPSTARLFKTTSKKFAKKLTNSMDDIAIQLNELSSNRKLGS